MYGGKAVSAGKWSGGYLSGRGGGKRHTILGSGSTATAISAAGCQEVDLLLGKWLCKRYAKRAAVEEVAHHVVHYF